jgi:hypothetical protein
VALQRAEEEKQLLLAEQAEKMAEERAAALAAVRQQATEEQEEAMDALRLESEKLLASIEGAMSKLRDERDRCAEDRDIAQAQLAEERMRVEGLKQENSALKRAGTVAAMKMYVLAGRYVSVLAAERRAAEERRLHELAELEALWSARLAECEARCAEWRRKFYVMCEMKDALAHTLTNFKREMLVNHKVKSTQLSQTLSALATTKAELLKEAQIFMQQVAETEGGIRTLEKEVNDLAKQSVIDKDGTVNVALTRRKKRLDKDMDSALVRMGDRRAALDEVKAKTRGVEEERARTEEELRQVEATFVATLVSQQRQLMTVLQSTPLTAEEMEVPADLRGDREEEEGEAGSGGGGENQVEAVGA